MRPPWTRGRSNDRSLPGGETPNISRGVLRIDCGRCRGIQSLASKACLRCVLTSMDSRQVESIELDGDWEVSYGESVASALASLSRAFVIACGCRSSVRLTERCRTCRSSPNNSLSGLLEDFPSISRSALNRVLTPPKLGVECGGCISDTERARAALLQAVRDLDSRLAKELYLVSIPAKVEAHVDDPARPRTNPK